MSGENKHPKKILVFGLPRTKTTVIQYHLHQLFGLQNFIEPFGGPDKMPIDQIYEWSKIPTRGIIKLLTTNILTNPGLDFVKLYQCGFDHLVVTKRNKIIDAALSLYYAAYISGQHHYSKDSQIISKRFCVDLDWLQKYCREIDVYYNTIDKIHDCNIVHDVIDYESYVPGARICIAYHAYDPRCIISPHVISDLNYRNLCDNYEIANTLIQDYITHRSQ